MLRVARRRNRRISPAARVYGRQGAGFLAASALVGALAYGLWPRTAYTAPTSKTGRLVAARTQSAPDAQEGEDLATNAALADRARMDLLRQDLMAIVRQAPARRAAVFVEDLETGLSAGVNADATFLAASLIKLPVMAAAYERWQAHPEQKTRLARTWLEWMITVSDNASTDRLIDLVGGPERVLQFCSARGISRFRVNHAILNHRGRGGRNTCTAREVVKLLAALDRRELVSPAADEEMWRVLCRQKKRLRIPAGVPRLAGVVVGNKTGTLGSALHDAAIVHTPRSRYAICVLLSGQRSESAGNRFCAQVSRRVFDALQRGPAPGQVIARGT